MVVLEDFCKQKRAVQDSHRLRPGPSGSTISCMEVLEDVCKRNAKKSNKGSSGLP